MKIAVIGGGPGGLYFAALAKQLDPRHEITVWERNASDDTFGFGVVFSDETLGGIEHADPAVFAAMQREFARWDDIDVHFAGQTFTSGGHGFAAIVHVDVVPPGELMFHRAIDLDVGVLDAAERLVGEDNAETERVVRGVSLPDGDLMGRVQLLGERGEVETAGSATDDRYAHSASWMSPTVGRAMLPFRRSS